MKTRILLFAGLLIVNYCIAISNGAEIQKSATIEGSVNVWSSPNLHHITSVWATEFNRMNPNAQINVITGGVKDIPGMLNGSNSIGFITDDSYISQAKQMNWAMVAGHDIIVPVMNSKNKFRDEIYKRGVNAERLSMTFTGSENQNWGMLLQNHSDIPVHFYIMADPTIKSSIANFLRYKKYMVEGINISSAREMISAIQNDPNAMGFCRLSDMIGIDGKELAENISLVPIDKNGNGKLDYMEDIYGDLQTFSRGVWIGKYPPSLTGNIHLVSGTKPTNETAVAFLRWVVSDGQQYLSTSGFASLVNNEMLVQLDNLSGKPERIATPEKNNSATLKLILLILCTVLFVGFIVDYIISRLRSTSGSSNGSNIPYSVVFDEKSVNVPLGIYYDRSHTWAFMEKDGTVKLGIDDFLQHVTGPITRIDMKQAGERIKKGDLIFTLVQKGKQLNIHAPISGTITAQNKTLNTRTSALNATPYTDGWIYMVEPTNWLREIQFLSMAEKYRSWLKDEFLRLKDFFATVIYANEQEYAHVVIQDGGAIKDCILADLGPEVWDDFQTKFIDCPK